jgi:hypothetical protein
VARGRHRGQRRIAPPASGLATPNPALFRRRIEFRRELRLPVDRPGLEAPLQLGQ